MHSSLCELRLLYMLQTRQKRKFPCLSQMVSLTFTPPSAWTLDKDMEIVTDVVTMLILLKMNIFAWEHYIYYVLYYHNKYV